MAVILRFLIFGGLNTAMSFAVYALLSLAGLHFTFASFGALVFGIVTGHWLSGKHVFGTGSWRTFFPYLVTWVLLYLGNISLIALFVRFEFGQISAGALAMIFIVPLSFVLQKFVVFRP